MEKNLQIYLDQLDNQVKQGKKSSMIVGPDLGKIDITALAAQQFFRSYQWGRVLYLHINEKTTRVENVYKKVFGDPYCYERYDGTENSGHEADFVFVSLETMAQNVDKFRPDEFVFIAIDNVYYLRTEDFRKVTEYFEPAFLLGVTIPHKTPKKGSRRYVRWTKETAIEALQDAFTSTPTYREIDQHPSCPGTSTLGELFGSVKQALDAAGFDVTRKRKDWDRSSVIDALQAAFPDHTPNCREVGNHPDCPCVSTIWKIFGSFTAALVAAGFESSPR